MEWRRKAGGDKKKERCDNLHEVHSGTRSNLVLAGIFRFELVIYNIVSIASNRQWAIFLSKIKYLDAL